MAALSHVARSESPDNQATLVCDSEVGWPAPQLARSESPDNRRTRYCSSPSLSPSPSVEFVMDGDNYYLATPRVHLCRVDRSKPGEVPFDPTDLDGDGKNSSLPNKPNNDPNGGDGSRSRSPSPPLEDLFAADRGEAPRSPVPSL